MAMTSFELFLQTVSAISAVIPVLTAQHERLSKLGPPELRTSRHRPDLTLAYKSQLKKFNDEAIEVGKKAFDTPSTNSNSQAIIEFQKAIPPATMEAMVAQVSECWNNLNHFLTLNEYPPEVRSAAHARLRLCVCRELKAILSYVDHLPEELQGMWNACGCKVDANSITL